MMSPLSRNLVVVAALAAGLSPIAPTHAQYYGGTSPAPLYPYAVQNSNGVQTQRSYAVQVAPNTYVIQRPADDTQAYPSVRRRSAHNPAPEKNAKRFDRPHKPVDHRLVEELRKRVQTNGTDVNTQQVVRDQPVVRETRRVVDDPPRVFTRRSVVEDQPDGSQITTVDVIPPASTQQRTARDNNKKRVIQADAEITVLGPDRMTIRLFRKGQGPKANARAD
jgi:hypothetical protein